jgi:hypothetical protein
MAPAGPPLPLPPGWRLCVCARRVCDRARLDGARCTARPFPGPARALPAGKHLLAAVSPVFRNYLLAALRAVRRQPGFAAVHVAGLALVGALVILHVVQDERAFDRPIEAAAAVSAHDEPANLTATPITPVERAEILERLYELVETHYVMADTARAITAYLRDQDIAGAYDDISDAATLAEVLTRDLRVVNGDRHLYVNHTPVEGAVGDPSEQPAVTPPDGPAALGFTRVETLDCKVGYIELGDALRQGPTQQGDHAVMAEVLHAVADADAIILDVRPSPGGSAGLANLLVSHFLPPGVHLLTVDSRRIGRVDRRYTAQTVPGPRRLNVPLYVLTSSRTFSAAEDIAFSLQSQGRATLIGERTGGGGRNNVRAHLGHGLTASVSATRVLDPRTGLEAWERRGVTPDIEAPGDDALEVAHGLACDNRQD